MKKLLLASAMCMVLPLQAMAQNGGGDMKLAPQDKMFIKKAAEAGLAEVADGKLAKAQGSGDVKKIGERMVKDHEQVNEQLASLSAQLGDPAPMTPGQKDEAMHEELAQLSGSAFDSQYLQEQESAHEKAIALFKKEADGGGNDQLKQLASDTLPTLQMHLQMIQKAMRS